MSNRRQDHSPLYSSREIYWAIIALPVGAMIPLNIYIQDYQDGTIPLWQIQEIERIVDDMIIVTLVDPATRRWSLFDEMSYVALDLFIGPERALEGRNYMYSGSGCEHARHMFCDIRQKARVLAESLAGVKQESFVTKIRQLSDSA